MRCPACELDLSTLPCQQCTLPDRSLAILTDPEAYIVEVFFADGRRSTNSDDCERAAKEVRRAVLGKAY